MGERRLVSIDVRKNVFIFIYMFRWKFVILTLNDRNRTVVITLSYGNIVLTQTCAKM
jgi:hypothetical protein